MPPPTPRALPHAHPNNMLIVTSLLKPDAAALLPRQHHVCRTTPDTTLTPRQYRWRCRPRCDGSVYHVVLVPSLSAGRPRRAFVRPRPRSSGERGVIVRRAGLLLAADATVASASRDDAAADSGREVSLDLFFGTHGAPAGRGFDRSFRIRVPFCSHRSGDGESRDMVWKKKKRAAFLARASTLYSFLPF